MQTKRRQNKTSRETAFKLMAPKARRVVVTGDFKSWDAKGIPLKKDRKGLWKTKVGLKPGRYEYKFIVDNEWRTDPDNKDMVRNSFGDSNSLMTIAA